MTGPVLVVGATGNVGGGVVRALVRRGMPVVAAGTDVVATRRHHPAVPVVRLDLHDPSTFDPALDGADGLFLVRPPHIARVGSTLNVLVDAAVRRGVSHVVFASVTGAGTNRALPHHRVETHLRRTAPSWTLLRPGFFAQNLADAYRADIVDHRQIVLPAGRGRVTFIDVRDIGEVAAAVFRDPAAHRGAAYDLTGPQALDFDQVAEILTRELGSTVRYRPVSAPAYVRHVRGQQLGWIQAAVQTVLHTGLRRGAAEQVDSTLARLLDRPPHTLEEYVHDHREVWRPA